MGPLEYLFKKLPIPTKRAKAKPYNALLLLLLACIRSYLKSVPRHKFLILDTYHPNTLYLRERECEDPWLLFEASRGPRAQMYGKHWFKAMYV